MRLPAESLPSPSQRMSHFFFRRVPAFQAGARTGPAPATPSEAAPGARLEKKSASRRITVRSPLCPAFPVPRPPFAFAPPAPPLPFPRCPAQGSSAGAGRRSPGTRAIHINCSWGGQRNHLGPGPRPWRPHTTQFCVEDVRLLHFCPSGRAENHSLVARGLPDPRAIGNKYCRGPVSPGAAHGRAQAARDRQENVKENVRLVHFLPPGGGENTFVAASPRPAGRQGVAAATQGLLGLKMKRGPGSPDPARRRRLGPACLHRDDFGPPGPAAGRPYAEGPRAAPSQASAVPLGETRPGDAHWRPSTSSGPVGAPVLQHEPLRVPPVDAPGARQLLSEGPDLLSLIRESASVEQGAHRSRAISAIHCCLQAALEESTKKRYSSSLRTAVDSFENSSGLQLLPCDSDVKFMLLFAQMDGRSWSSVTNLRAAVRCWHQQRNLTAQFDSAWTDRSAQFWRGLKKRADHSRSHAKRPVSLEELRCYQTARLKAGSLAAVRDVAIAAVSFFGVRRCSETLALRRRDISVHENFVTIFVARQKNDPFGQGMVCHIPKMVDTPNLCPCHVLQAWLVQRDSRWGSDPDAPVFCTTHLAEPRPMNCDSFRRNLSQFFQTAAVGTHSLRKGGAHWYKAVCCLPEELVQAQGGWSAPEAMQADYAHFSDSEKVRSTVARRVSSFK